MALGLGVLLLPPHVFWSTTARELDAMLRGKFGILGGNASALSRRELSDLMDRFPD